MSIWVVVGLGATALGAFVIGALANLIGISAATLWISGVGLIAILILSRRAPKDTPHHLYLSHMGREFTN